jgi:transcriptional regulator of acetoin/glycerol metabolism
MDKGFRLFPEKKGRFYMDAGERGWPELRFECDAVEALLCAPWKRNVREMRSLVANLAQMVWPHAPQEALTVKAADLPGSLTTPITTRGRAPAAPILKKHTRPSAEALTVALEEYDGNVLRVAEHYGRDRRQIYRWMERYGLK